MSTHWYSAPAILHCFTGRSFPPTQRPLPDLFTWLAVIVIAQLVSCLRYETALSFTWNCSAWFQSFEFISVLLCNCTFFFFFFFLSSRLSTVQLWPSGLVQKLLWKCTGIALIRFLRMLFIFFLRLVDWFGFYGLRLIQNQSEIALKLLWKCSATALKLLWSNSCEYFSSFSRLVDWFGSDGLHLIWNYSKIALELLWNCSGTALFRFLWILSIFFETCWLIRVQRSAFNSKSIRNCSEIALKLLQNCSTRIPLMFSKAICFHLLNLLPHCTETAL